MKKNFLIVSLLTLLFISCQDEEARTVKVKGKYAIDIPGFLTETNQINEDASLQYANVPRELNIIVIDEPVTDVENAITENNLENYYSNDLDGYVNLLTDGLDTEVELDSTPKIKSLTINGLEARRMDFTGKTDDLHIYWKFTFLKGRNTYYQVITWTLADKKEENEPVMEKMVNSFTETDKSKK